MPAININDLNNAQLDVNTIASVATSTAATVTDRLGNVKSTVFAAVQTLKAFNVRGAWATATAYALKDVYTFSGYAYVAVTAHTSTTVAADLASGYVTIHQGATKEDLAAPTGAGLLGFVQAGAGTVLRTLQSKNRDTVNFRDFGAVGDGVTDDTSAILSAFAAASTAGAQIAVTSGTYVVTGIALSNLTNVDIVSAGGSLFLKNASNKTALTILNCGFVRINGLQIDCNKAGQSLAAFGGDRLKGSGILVQGFTTCEVSGCTVVNASSGAGILVTDPTVMANSRTHTNISAKVFNNKIRDSGNGTGAALTCDGIYTQCNNIEIYGNEVVSFNDYGIVCEFGANMNVHDNKIDGNFVGVYGVSFQGCFRFSANDNQIVNCCGGIAAFVQSNPVADPFFNIFGLIDGNIAHALGVPNSPGNNTGVNVGQFGATITIVAKLIGAGGNGLALAQTGGHFVLPPGNVLAAGAYGVPANGTIKLSGVVAGDTLTVNGVVFTAVASGASGNQFNVATCDAKTAEALGFRIQSSASGLDAYSGGHIHVRNNDLEKGDRGVSYTGHQGSVENNSCKLNSLESIRVIGYGINTSNRSAATSDVSYINSQRGTVDEQRNNIQRRASTLTVTNPAFGRPFYVKTDDLAGIHSAIVVINASGSHPTGPAPVFVQRRLLIKSSAGSVSVVDFDAGPVGDTTLLTVTAGGNGAGRAEILARPSTGVMTINMVCELTALDDSDAFYLLETA